MFLVNAPQRWLRRRISGSKGYPLLPSLVRKRKQRFLFAHSLGNKISIHDEKTF